MIIRKKEKFSLIGNKHKTIFLIAGILVGFIAAAAGGLMLHKVKAVKDVPKRYEAVLPTVNDQGFGVFTASSLDRIFKDGKTLHEPVFGQTAELSLARNEYESFQIVVQTQDKTLRSVSFEISNLVNGESGVAISRDNVSWRVVGYVPTIKPYYPVQYVGLWPDPLLPSKKTDVPVNTVQPFWVTLYVPSDTQPGLYVGKITMTAEGVAPIEISLKVRVYDFILPVESSLKTAFDFYGHITHMRYPRGEKESKEAYKARISEINDKFIMEMLRYRMNPILNVDPTKDSELARIDRYRTRGLNNFAIGKRGGTFQNNWPWKESEIENLFTLYRTYGELLKLNKLLQYTYIYTWDEGGIGNPVVAKICSMIHRAYPGLKNMVCYHGFWDPEKNPDWGKDIDIWCFQIDNFVEEKMRKLQRIGKEIWMYISGPSGYGSPNLAVDFDSVGYRMVPWLCWKYDIKGFLYWCVNFWELGADPFQNANNTKWEQNGNGFLFYPGENGPMASLRTELFRDGMEDYEYIQALMQRLRWLKTQGLDEKGKSFIQESITLLTVDPSIAESMMSYSKDGERLKARRNAIAERIEEFDKRFKDY